MTKTAPARGLYRAFVDISTRWADNDAYGHVNNVIYYAFFDTAVNQYLIAHGVLDVGQSPVIGLVAETSCRYFASVAFPDAIQVGLKVTHIGTSSVRYDLAVFANNAPTAAAVGHFVHVYVDRASGRPHPIPQATRAVLEMLQDG